MDNSLKKQSEKYLNDIRLYRYYEIGNENYLEKYALNMEVSEKLLSMISLFEVIYRNKAHTLLSTHLSTDYLTNPNLHIFSKEEIKSIKRAYRKAEKAKTQIKDSKAITYLTLGFWCNLVKKNQLWCKYLYQLFPQEIRQKHKLSNIIEMIDSIHTIRNMISHHERIISKPGINISGTSDTLTKLTIWLIEREDKDFHDYIEAYLCKKSDEIIALLSKK